MSSLPVPVSPWISSGASTAATRAARAFRARMGAESPMMDSKPASPMCSRACMRSPMRRGACKVITPPAAWPSRALAGSVTGRTSIRKGSPCSITSRSGARKPPSTSCFCSCGSPNSSLRVTPVRAASGTPATAAAAALATMMAPQASTVSTGSAMEDRTASRCRRRRVPGRMSTSVASATPATSSNAWRSSARRVASSSGTSM